MGTLFQDIRFAVRSLLRRPLFTAIGVLTLALGIGLNTAVFSAIEALLLRPLPGTRAPEEVVQIYRSWPGMSYGSSNVPHYVDVKERGQDLFQNAAIWDYEFINLSFNGQNERAMASVVSASYFPTLGVEMAHGRSFTADEDVGYGAHPVAILSYSSWQRKFGGDPAIVGKQMIINGQAYTIVGITAKEFVGAMPMVAPTVFVPLMQLVHISGRGNDVFEKRDNNFMNMIARLKPGVTAEQAQARLTAINRQIAEQYPRQYKGSGMLLVRQSDAGIHPMFRQTQVQMSSLIMAVVAMLLLIACVNVANLFLARASERSREMAVRLSIGARRARLIRQLLTESILFAIVSGVVGLLIASWAISIANGVRIPMDIDMQPNLQLSIPVLAFSLAISLAVGMLFGLAPALQATRPSLVPALKGEAPAGGSRSRLSAPLVVAQMALSLMLLTCAGLFLRNIRLATNLDKGFAAQNVLMADVDPQLQGYTRARTEQFYNRLMERVKALPGVEGVGLIDNPQLGLSNSDTGVEVDGYVPAPEESMSIQYGVVSPGYFEALQVPLLKGRTFTLQDDSTAAPAIIVNQRFVDRFLQGRDPIGAKVKHGAKECIIVGVTTTGKYRSLGEEPTAFIYFPQLQNWSSGMNIVVRTAGDPMNLVPTLRSEVAAMDPTLPLGNIKSLTTHLGLALLPSRIAGTALGVFGLLGLLLAAVGMYGVMSYSVAQRTREIGIRMAIGSSRGEVVRLVIGQGMRLVGIGMALGLVGALGAARLVRGLLYGGSSADPITIGVVSLVLISVALLAVWIPARRASGVDPIRALRTE